MTPVDLSIVIVNHNTRKLLLECLASIFDKQHSISFECIVVDNESSDRSIEAVRAAYPSVRIIANPVGRFFAGGNNQGIKAATGRYVVVLNPDMVVLGNTLSQLVHQMDQHPEIGAASTVLRFPDGKIQSNGSREVTLGYLILQYTFLGKLFPGVLRKRNDDLWYKDWDRQSPRSIGVLPGCCIIAKRDTWLDVNGFNEQMPMYFTDDYFSKLVRNRGRETGYLISDGIIHYEGSVTTGGAKRVLTRRYLNMYFHDLLTYTRLVFGFPAQVLLTVLLIPTFIVQFMKAR